MMLSRLDLPTLTCLSEAAFDTKTLAEFEAMLTKLTTDQPSGSDND